MALSQAVMMWPTPTVHGNYNRRKAGTKSGDGLATAVKMWPMPTVDAANERKTKYAQGGQSLSYAVKMWATPIARDWKGEGYLGQLGTEVGGQLNPTWAEWLMGWPLGWSELRPLEMVKFRQWLQQFGNLLEIGVEAT